MKRKDTGETAVIKLRRVSGGTHYHGDQVVRKGEVLRLRDMSELSPLLRTDYMVISDPTEGIKREIVSKLTLVHRGGGKFNVVNVKTGEPINDKLLTKSEALALIDDEPEGMDE